MRHMFFLNTLPTLCTKSNFMSDGDQCKLSKLLNTSYQPKSPRQTVQTQIRLLLMKQSDQGIPFLLFWQAFYEFQPWKETFTWIQKEKRVRNFRTFTIIEPRHEIFNNVVCANSKGSDQPAHTRSLIRSSASRLNNLRLLSYWLNIIWSC